MTTTRPANRTCPLCGGLKRRVVVMCGFCWTKLDSQTRGALIAAPTKARVAIVAGLAKNKGAGEVT